MVIFFYLKANSLFSKVIPHLAECLAVQFDDDRVKSGISRFETIYRILLQLKCSIQVFKFCIFSNTPVQKNTAPGLQNDFEIVFN